MYLDNGFKQNMIYFNLKLWNYRTQAENSTYDSCVLKDVLPRLTCKPMFLNLSAPNLLPCPNYLMAMGELAKIQIHRNKCPSSSLHVEIHSNFITDHHLLQNNYTVFEENEGYHIVLPYTVQETTNVPDYTVLTYVAEIGGWTTLFTGISMLAVMLLSTRPGASSDCKWIAKLVQILSKAVYGILIVLVIYSISRLVQLYIGKYIT